MFLIKAFENSKSFFQTNLKLIYFKDIVETHPGLEFLRDAPDFHSRYIHTVSSLIIYNNYRLLDKLFILVFCF